MATGYLVSKYRAWTIVREYGVSGVTARKAVLLLWGGGGGGGGGGFRSTPGEGTEVSLTMPHTVSQPTQA